MTKKDYITVKGLVDECLTGSTYKVILSNEHAVIAYTAGKMKKHHIRIIPGDYVTVEIHRSDPKKGRITFREKAPPQS